MILANITLSPEDEWPWGSDWTITVPTMIDGYAFFDKGLPPGNYSCSAYLENGSLIGVFSIEIFPDGSFHVKDGTIPMTPLPSAGDDDDEPIDDDEPVDDDDQPDDDEPVDDDEPIDDDDQPDDDEPVDDDDPSSEPVDKSSNVNKFIFAGIVIIILIAVLLGIVINRMRDRSTDMNEDVPDLLIPEEPMVEGSIAGEPAVGGPSIQEPISETPAVEEPSIEEPMAEIPVIKEPVSEIPSEDEPTLEE